MNKKDITTKDDVFLLVSSFYKKVRIDKELGAFFETVEDWDEHIEKLTTFWQSNLFLKTRYYGNPIEAHIRADNSNDNAISEYHFGLWLNLWMATIDSLFAGQIAQNAKHRARKMSTFLNINIFKARNI
ncbi:MAG: group III truncated hemoglobin [Flavobacteriaceae bacterium]|nr:group III truncated hemoglobin [Flavobacteriaceae bacterium]